MDIIRVQRNGKKKLAAGLGRQSQGKRGYDSKRDNFPEADYNDPLVKQWCEEVDKNFNEKFGPISHKELFKIQELSEKVRKQNPHLTFNEAVNVVLEKIAFKKRI